MRCPFCDRDQTTVLESRMSEGGNCIRRRRDCLACNKRFTTYERIEGPVLQVVKKDGRREQFDRNKLVEGVRAACSKRPVNSDQIDELVYRVERELMKSSLNEVPSRMIGKSVLRRLKKIDRVAWLRFASVYLAFETLADFGKVIDKELG